jgi:PAS domain S-box-containing protein
VTDARGRIIAATDFGSVGQDLSEQIWFRFVRDHGGVHVQDAAPSQVLGGALAVTFTAPLKSPAGKFLGVVTSRVRVSDLEHIFKEAVRSFEVQHGKAGRLEYQFLARDGEVIADSVLRQEDGVNLKLLGLPSALFIGSAQPGYVEEMHLRRHVPIVTGYAQAEQHGNFAGLHWGVLVRMDRQDILAPINRVLRILAAGGAVILVPMIGFLVWSTGRLRREWTLAQEESARAAVAEAKFRGLLEFAPDAFVIVNREGRIILVNAQTEKLFGYVREELIGQSVEMLMPEGFRSQHVGHRTQYATDPRPRAMGACLDLLARRKDGSNVSIDISLGSLMAGDEMLMTAAVRDITEHKQALAEIRKLNAELEHRVVERTSELEATNKELEAFSYSVSHDLRAPLRAIDGFSRILMEEYAPHLPEEAGRYLRLVRSNTQAMGHLVDDLLAFARLSRQPLKKQLVAPADLVRQCLDELRSEQEGRGVKITIGALPVCQADPALLKQVWINLLANALKFTREREIAFIEIGSRTDDARPGEPVYFVKDNGTGFDMQYADKLFGVFQRLHRAEDYEGTGVGLAIVQRIIHRHGGRVWADAAVGHGATVYLTLGGGPSNA